MVAKGVGYAMRVLLHACCGPCLIVPGEALSAEHDVCVLYANPNIAPHEEWERRLETLVDHAADVDFQVLLHPYDDSEWASAVQGHEDDPPARCKRCFEMRMMLTARYAAEEGFDAFATTLTVSPYQDAEAIETAGAAAAKHYDVAYMSTDFRERYREATDRSRDLGMYRQSYCGCKPSVAEAEETRRRLREDRKARRREGRHPG